MFKSLMLSVALTALASSAQAAEPKLQVVASFSILGDMVSRVGGDLVDVKTIVGPNADTHVYEPTPADAKSVSTARVFFVNGLGFEGWMDRFVQSSGFKGELVVASKGVTSRHMEDDGKEITDPHAWQNLGNGMLYVKNIVAGLCKADAKDCDTFTKNGDAYTAELSALDAEVKAKVATIAPAHRLVITTHDAFGYFGQAYGVKFEAPEGLSTDAEPSAAGVAKLITQIRTEHATALFFENMSDPRVLEQISHETGVKAGGTLYADALSAPGEGGASYLELFKHNIGLLVAAMNGS